MTTLTTAPLKPLLDWLFEEAAAHTPQHNPAFAGLSAEALDDLIRSKANYLNFYSSLKDYHLAVSPATGTLLYMLARNHRVQTIVEFGTSFGVSTLHLAAALRDNGGGRLISTEFEASKVARARQNLIAGGLLDLVEIREGDALHTLAHGLPEQIDMLVLDGAKALYPDILDRVESRLKPGALIVADDAEHSPEYLARVQSPGNGYLSIPVADGVELSMRLG